MTAGLLRAPPGDAAELRAAAARFGAIAEAHYQDLSAFQAHVRTALNGWTGAVAEQYAVAAGQTCTRFTGLCNALKDAQLALNKYATAVEEAQYQAARLTTPPELVGVMPSEESLTGGSSVLVEQKYGDILDGLDADARSCATTLYRAEAELGASCPDVLTARQLLNFVRQVGGKLTSPQAVDVYGLVMSGYALWDLAEHGKEGSETGAEIAKASQTVDISETAEKLLARYGGDSALLSAWAKLSAGANAGKLEVVATSGRTGSSLLAGLLHARQIGINDQGAHAAPPASAWEAFTDAARQVVRPRRSCGRAQHWARLVFGR